MKHLFSRILKFLTHENKKEWSRRRFRFYILFADVKNGTPPWNKAAWNEVYEPLFHKLLQCSPEHKHTGVKVSAQRRMNDQDYYTELKPGRLRWDKKSHDKWTVEVNSDIKFNSLECWAPIWTTCDKTSSAPDVFFSIQNEADSIQRFGKLQFDVFIVIAIAEDLNVDATSIVADLSKTIDAKRTLCHTRRWSTGKNDPQGHWKFHNWIQDTWSNGIYKGASLHEFDFEQLKVEPYWEIVYHKPI